MRLEAISSAQQKLNAVAREVARGIVGQERLIRDLELALAANGHVLIEGVPGLAKTRAVRLLSQACGGSFQRIQFTPDLLPADIIGTQIYNQESREFETRLGPVFSQFILADEINRAAPKVQSALLEAMQERQVTIGRQTHPLPPSFQVFATQNPVEQEGTYPLPEAQVDRFLFKLVLGYPGEEEEQAIVRLVMNEFEFPEVNRVLDDHDLLNIQAAVREIFVEDAIIAYATSLVLATRDAGRTGATLVPFVELGASPRASLALVLSARANALIEGRDSVYPEDIKRVAANVLRHRIIVNYVGHAEGVTPDAVIEEILQRVQVP